jgi:hypothetical protein
MNTLTEQDITCVFDPAGKPIVGSSFEDIMQLVDKSVRDKVWSHVRIQTAELVNQEIKRHIGIDTSAFLW